MVQPQICVKVAASQPFWNAMICLERGHGASWGAWTRPAPPEIWLKLFGVLVSSVLTE